LSHFCLLYLTISNIHLPRYRNSYYIAPCRVKKEKGKKKKKDEMNRDEGRKARVREYEITRVMFFFSLE